MISLRIITPHGVFLEQDVLSIHAKSTEGEFTILPNHIAAMFSLVPCRLILKSEKGTEVFAISGGFLQFHDNKARLLCEAIEGSREIDLIRAQEAYRRARERLERHDESVDLRRAELALQRAINRIHIKNAQGNVS